MIHLFFTAIAFCICATSYGGPFFFSDGDTVAFLGDSVTEMRYYTNDIELWAITRFPTWKITFRNVGLGGDRAFDGNLRFKRDVLVNKPTALLVNYGLNDVGTGVFDSNLKKEFAASLRAISAQATAAGIRTAWLTSQAYERMDAGPAYNEFNQTLWKFFSETKAVAATAKEPFVDQFSPYLNLIAKARRGGPAIRVGGGDALHPTYAGGTFMAYTVLKELQFPTFLSSVEIDARASKVVDAKGARVSGLASSSNSVQFDQLDSAIPYFSPMAKSILDWVNIENEMNDLRLRIRNLSSGDYVIRLDGTPVAVRSAAQLDAGVPMAAALLYDGAVHEQVLRVWQAMLDKNSYYHDHVFRDLLVQSAPPDPITLEDRLAEVKRLDEKLRLAAQPETHHFEVVPFLTSAPPKQALWLRAAAGIPAAILRLFATH